MSLYVHELCFKDAINEKLIMKDKVCVSLFAETLYELKQKLDTIRSKIIELRLDYLESFSIRSLKEFLKELDKYTDKQIILTYRPKHQGGKKDLDRDERLNFWRNLTSEIKSSNLLIDLEFDLLPEAAQIAHRKIISFHCFSDNPSSLEQVYRRLSTHANIVKLAVFVDDAVDALEVFKLLEFAEKEERQLISIAMGEAGKWTRILAPAYGAYLTFASLEKELETAPGQLSLAEALDLYRINQLTKKTSIYGLVAGETSYSISPQIHNKFFIERRLDAVFIPFQVRDLDRFMKKMILEEEKNIDLNFKGFAVTNPHKESIINYLDEIDDTVRVIKAVNTIKIQSGKLKGYNTDEKGFIEPLSDLYGDLKDARVAVIGSGGAARACIFALKKHGARVTIFARNLQKAKALADEFQVSFRRLPNQTDINAYTDFDVLVNATPVGTKGLSENESIATADQLRHLHLVYDLVYNPLETKLMKEAKIVDIPRLGGLAMLISQAKEQQRIWLEGV